jgi:hypothetical protein
MQAILPVLTQTRSNSIDGAWSPFVAAGLLSAVGATIVSRSEGSRRSNSGGGPGSIGQRDAQPPPEAPNGLVFVKEGELRDRIVESPSKIPEIDEPAAAAKEVAIPPAIGRADVVVVETDGMIRIVACTLEGNPSSHGSVIGQALSYAAGLRGLSYDEVKERFEGPPQRSTS